jgi:hypothetical protein
MRSTGSVVNHFALGIATIELGPGPPVRIPSGRDTVGGFRPNAALDGGRGCVRLAARIHPVRGKSRHEVSSTSKFTVCRDVRRMRPRRRNRSE